MKGSSNNIREELEGLSPLLSSMKERHPREGFDLPPAYFRDLPVQVLQKIRKEKQASPPWWQAISNMLRDFFQPRYALGLATIALLIVAGLLILDGQKNAASTDIFHALTAEEVDAYIQSNIHEFEADLVIEAAEQYQHLSVLPGTSLEEELDEEYYEEILQDLDEESIEDLL